MNEIWEYIEGFEGLYQVSDCGQIKILARVVTLKDNTTLLLKERILKPGLKTTLSKIQKETK